MSDLQRLDTSPAGLVARATGELRQGAYREASATALVAIAAVEVEKLPQPMTVTVKACPQCGGVGQPTVEFPTFVAPPPFDGGAQDVLAGRVSDAINAWKPPYWVGLRLPPEFPRHLAEHIARYLLEEQQ